MKILANVTNDIGKFTLLNKIIAFQSEVEYSYFFLPILK